MCVATLKVCGLAEPAERGLASSQAASHKNKTLILIHELSKMKIYHVNRLSIVLLIVLASIPVRAQTKEMIFRISEIEIYKDSLKKYKAILKEEADASLRVEPGVISIFPMFLKKDSTQIRILEIYASKEAYQAHIKSPHFLKYKTSTLKMVKSLILTDMEAIDPESLTLMFKKAEDKTGNSGESSPGKKK